MTTRTRSNGNNPKESTREHSQSPSPSPTHTSIGVTITVSLISCATLLALCTLLFLNYSEETWIMFPEMTPLQRYVTQPPWKINFHEDVVERYSTFARPAGFVPTMQPLESLNHTCVFNALADNPGNMHYDHVVYMQMWPVTYCLDRLKRSKYCNMYYLRKQSMDIVDMITAKWDEMEASKDDDQDDDQDDDGDGFMQENSFIAWGLRGEVDPRKRIRGQSTGPKCCIRPHVPGVIDLPDDIPSAEERLLPFGRTLEPQHGTRIANRTTTAVIESKYYDEKLWPDLSYPRELLEAYPNHGTILRQWQKHGSCILHRDAKTSTASASAAMNSESHQFSSFDDYLQLVNAFGKKFNLTDVSPNSPISLLQSTGAERRINLAALSEQIRDYFSLPSPPQLYCIDYPDMPYRMLLGVGVCFDRDIIVERNQDGSFQNVNSKTVPCPPNMPDYIRTILDDYHRSEPRLCSSPSSTGDNRNEWVVLPGVESLNQYHILKNASIIALDKRDPAMRDSMDVLTYQAAEDLIFNE